MKTNDRPNHPYEDLQLLNERQAAELLNISPRTLWGHRKAGKLPCVRIGASVRYSPSDLQEWIAAQREGGQQ